MFSLLNRATSSSSLHRSRPSNESLPSSTSSPRHRTAPPVSLQASIDGPPSSEHIRAYTEQMKRGSVFAGRTRSHTNSSATPSFRSSSSGTTSATGEAYTLSRQSSQRSNASSMPLKNGERPESLQIFGRKFFSRNSRKVRRETGSRSSSSLSTDPSLVGESQSAKDYYYDTKKTTRRGTFSASAPSLDETMKHNISQPYNFQHLTHTRHEQLPNLHRTSRTELVSEFSAIRASQAPSHGHLKGIRADDLHFKNFSSEALSSPNGPESPETRPRTSPQRPQQSPTIESGDYETLRKLTQVKSCDSLRNAPPRPPRSPPRYISSASFSCPPPPPPRTSSRTASMLLGNNFDPLATTSLERPGSVTNNGFRKPKAFHLPTAPPRPITRSETPENVVAVQEQIQQNLNSSPRSPDLESWPLPSPFEGLGLADVPEEEEGAGHGGAAAARRRSRMSQASAELRPSKSVPNLSPSRKAKRASRAVEEWPSMQAASEEKGKLEPETMLHDSWEDDVDYCYEHEVEADCDYEWDRESVVVPGEAEGGKGHVPKSLSPPPPAKSLPSRPSLMLPAPVTFPPISSPLSSNVSPISNNSNNTSPNLLRPHHLRSTSHASSFKESHGFHLSPSLLIPADFAGQMDTDRDHDDVIGLYEDLGFDTRDSDDAGLGMGHSYGHYVPEHYGSGGNGAAEQYGSGSYVQGHYVPVSPVDDGPSSTASYRSSAFSRASGASITRTAATSSGAGGSQESILLSRAASVALAHRSMSSSSSLPELVHSSSRTARATSASPILAEPELPLPMPMPEVSPVLSQAGEVDMMPAPLRRKPSLGLGLGAGVGMALGDFSGGPEREQRKIAMPPPVSMQSYAHQLHQHHGRKVSAPVNPSQGVEAQAQRAAGRKRAMSAKSRASYALFPQI